jgi:hypothetical protein
MLLCRFLLSFSRGHVSQITLFYWPHNFSFVLIAVNVPWESLIQLKAVKKHNSNFTIAINVLHSIFFVSSIPSSLFCVRHSEWCHTVLAKKEKKIKHHFHFKWISWSAIIKKDKDDEAGEDFNNGSFQRPADSMIFRYYLQKWFSRNYSVNTLRRHNKVTLIRFNK